MNSSVIICMSSLMHITICFQVFAQGDARSELINAEYQFAAAASATNTREAFLSHLSPECLVVREGQFVNGPKDWQTREVNSSLLSWYPSYADVAPSGDLGVSAGPWEFWKNRQDSNPSAFGHFVSIWKKQTNGEWKVALDIGVSHPEKSSGEKPLPKGSPEYESNRWSDQRATVSNRKMLDLERSLIGRYRTEGRKAFADALSENLRVYRGGMVPLTGDAAREEILNETRDTFTFSVIDGGVSSSGDWGYVCGNILVTTGDGEERQEPKAAYMRVWEKSNQSEWKIVLDIVSE